MALTTEERAELTTLFQREESKILNEIGISKTELRDAINAVDDWIDTNQSSYNTNLPLPARTYLTAKQKALLLSYVALKRTEVI